jgi:PPK2 family polyphosphate:nucleotide phosphotransferase
MGLLTRLDDSKKIRLQDFDPDDHGGMKKADAEKVIQQQQQELGELQMLLYASQQTPILIVLQGLDTAGKDGTIRHVMAGMSPQSCRVASFKVPSPLEQSHDFLWRIHAETPSRGTVAIFNRSHYEDVLVVRVHDLVPKDIWQRRYDHINHFEKLLSDNDTIILKFFLHISKDEQGERLKDRETDPMKTWKVSVADWKERNYWDQYQTAYEDVLNRCSAPHAPWYIVPANHKWFRNYAIAETIAGVLRPMKEKWTQQLEKIGKDELQQVRAMRQHHAHPS